MNSEYEWICSACERPLPERGETFAYCPYCGASVTDEVAGDESPAAIADVPEESDSLKVLTRVPTEAEASLIVQRLTSQDIAAQAVGAYTSGFAAQAPGDVSVLVERADWERALSALATVRPDGSSGQTTDEEEGESACGAESRRNEDVAFACQECGKAITLPGDCRGHVETCPHCAAFVDVPDEKEESPLPKSETAASPATPGSVESAQPKGDDSSSRTTTWLWIEVLAVLCLAYIPDLFSSTFAYVWRPTRYPLVYRDLWLIVRSLQVSLPLLAIMALSKDPWSLFGIVRPRWIADIAGGCAIWLVGLVACRFAMTLLPPSVLEPIRHLLTWPKGTPAHLLLLAACVANGFAEELVMRGCLLPRLERLLRSTWLAVLVTTAMFASYHLYQGVPGVAGAAAVGVVYAASFCFFRRLWPLCVAHALADFMPYL